MKGKKLLYLLNESNFQRVLDWSIGKKLHFIGNNLAKYVNLVTRGGKKRCRSQEEIYHRLFNGLDDDPQGEFSELRDELVKRRGNANYIGDLGDCLYNSLRYQFAGIPLLAEVYGIGKILDFKKEHIIDGCIIKYRFRCANRGKNYPLERALLGNHMTHVPEPSDRQIECAIERIDHVLSHKDSYTSPDLLEKLAGERLTPLNA